MKILFTVLAIVILLTITFILVCCRDNEIAFVDYMQKVELSLNTPFQTIPESDIEITALEISKSRQCLICIKKLSTGETKSGWVKEGDFVSFAPEEVGVSGLQLHAVSEMFVTLNFRYGRCEK